MQEGALKPEETTSFAAHGEGQFYSEFEPGRRR